MVKYPEGPPPAGRYPEDKFDLAPGEGINAKPYDAEELLDFTAPVGKCTGAYYGIALQLPKWGFQRYKIDEWIFVSPVNKPYYDLTIDQREKLQAQIKAGLASIAQTVADLELVLHDLRKYKQYLEYFEQIKKAEQLIKQGKKEEGEKLKRQMEQTLRSIFIDQVDAYTDLPNVPVALRSIATRWPTVISDFMKLSNEKSPDEIKLDVSEAEKLVLVTKNKLFLQWKDMFGNTVKERYTRLKQLAEARKKSLEEYKDMLKPTIARYKMINDALSTSKGRSMFYTSFFHPEAQAFSVDQMVLWAWKPFAPTEKYKISRERFDKVSAYKAGFTKEEVKRLLALGLIKKDLLVDALPVEPSIDSVVRRVVPEIEKEYNVRIQAEDLFKARQELLNQYKIGMKGLGLGETWVFSPYFIFLEIPLNRTVLRLPDGSQLEDLMLSNMKGYTETQNIILSRVLEVKAKEKSLENYIAQLMGEFGIKGKGALPTEELLKEEFPGIYGEPEKKEEVKKKFNLALKTINLGLEFIRAKGPYEFAMADRISKYYQTTVGMAFSQIKSYLESAFNVPGVSVQVRV